MIANDPLSLLFIGCFLFGLLFLVVTTLLGNLGHSGHGGLDHNADITHHGAHVVTHHVGDLQGKGIHIHTHAPSHSSTAKGSPQVDPGNAFALFSYLNPTSVVLFLLGFGFFGYVFHNTASLALPLTLILALLCGMIVAALLLVMLSRIFGDSEGATIQDVSDRTGMLGKVSVTIQQNALGEVLYISPGGMRKSIPARSIDGRRLERDQEVVVVNYQHGVAEVDTWDHFVNQDQSDTPHASDMSDNADPSKADELAELRALLDEPNKTDAKLVMRKDQQKE
jgi:hypothetical protein